MQKIINGKNLYLKLESESQGFSCTKGWYYKIYLNDNNKDPIGEIELHPNDSSEYIAKGNIGYLIYPLYRGHGYAKEASEVLLKYAYEYLGMKNIRVTMLPNNEASKHIAESLGGTYIEYAKVPKRSKLYGTIEGVLVYNIDLESKKGKKL